ncbi:MAG: 2-dehydropantoate 2-reductase, partial [Phycisphaerae bacterium]|nr:2-dehydropantoate 2-reductase [Phycisphaerae bacterium]
MRICIYGAGAIGGLLGAKLSLAGEEVTLIGRGPHLETMRHKGLTLISGSERLVARPRCTADPTDAGAQDCVIVTLKSHSAPHIVNLLQPLLGPKTSVVTAVNGVPWWYFHELKGPWRNTLLESVDPGGRQWRLIGPTRAIGCVVYPACEVIEPSVVRHMEGDRFTLGEPSGEKTERVCQLSSALTRAGFKAPVRQHIRNEIWIKLWGNLC